MRSREGSHRFGRVWPRVSPTPAAFPLRLTSIVQTSVFLFGLVGPPSEFDFSSSSSAPTDRSSAAPAGKTPAVAEQSRQPAPTSSKQGGHRGGDVPSFAAIPGTSATDETNTPVTRDTDQFGKHRNDGTFVFRGASAGSTGKVADATIANHPATSCSAGR